MFAFMNQVNSNISLFFAGCLNQFLHRIQIYSFQVLPPADSILSEIPPKEFTEKVFS